MTLFDLIDKYHEFFATMTFAIFIVVSFLSIAKIKE